MTFKSSHSKSLVIIASLFFLFGFITCMNDVLMPHLKGAFTLNWRQAALIQFSFFSAFFLISIPASYFCERVGYQTGICLGLGVTAIGAFSLMIATYRLPYSFFLISLLILASGITLIQVAANPYVTLLGDSKTASSRLTIIQAFNSLGTTIAPLVGSTVILSKANLNSIRAPYFLMGSTLVLLSLLIFFIEFPHFSRPKKDKTTWLELLKNRQLLFGALAIFTYVGAEVSIGSYLVGWLTSSFVTALNIKVAANFVSLYWGGAMIGRFLGTPLLVRFEPACVLLCFAAGAMTLVSISIGTGGVVAQWSILGVGLFNSIMFPTIFSMCISGLKYGKEKASGLLCTSIVGGAIVPFIQGIVADNFSLRSSFLLPIICYFYLLIFSFLVLRRGSFLKPS
jgi:MFS transporter, FHS family, L-fucose permease